MGAGACSWLNFIILPTINSGNEPLKGRVFFAEEAASQCEDGFAHAIDLVRYTRQEFGDYFGIAVAGMM